MPPDPAVLIGVLAVVVTTSIIVLVSRDIRLAGWECPRCRGQNRREAGECPYCACPSHAAFRLPDGLEAHEAHGIEGPYIDRPARIKTED